MAFAGECLYVGQTMEPRDAAMLATLEPKAAGAIAIEALWDGDTQGWYVELYAVSLGALTGYSAAFLGAFREGGDIRLFNGEVPPWPEAGAAVRIGQQLAECLGVPFHFPSPNHPEMECPHWWELDESSPCGRCGIALLQPPDCSHRGMCSHCHIDIERETREAAWSPEERSAPRCHICGGPAVGSTQEPARCASCRQNYRSFDCVHCGARMTVHRDHDPGATACGTCTAAHRLSTFTAAQRGHLREALSRGMIEAIVSTRAMLGCGIGDAQEVLAVLARTPKDEP